MHEYYAAAGLAVLLTAVSQFLLKLGVDRAGRGGVLWVYLNPFSIAAYITLFLVTLLNVYAYQYLPLKIVALFQPFTYILIGLLSLAFLKEQFAPRQLLGALIIITGVVVYGLAGW